MRIFGITDVHGNLRLLKRLADYIASLDEKPEAIFIAGDITNFGNSTQAERVLRPLLSLEIPLLAVHGNCDGRDVPGFLEELGISAHGRRIEISGLGIVGIGGSNITPFNTIWELSEDKIAGILEENYRNGDSILSHAPPHGTRTDLTHFGLHVGSRALREFIENKKPLFVLTGHIHEARSIDRIGKTLIINPGPLFQGYYSVVEIDEGKVKVKLEKL